MRTRSGAKRVVSKSAKLIRQQAGSPDGGSGAVMDACGEHAQGIEASPACPAPAAPGDTDVATSTGRNKRATSTCSTPTAPRPRRPRSTGTRKNMMKESLRKAFLERDEWAMDVEPRSVTCGGCRQTLGLDKRNGTYYASLWLKHRRACRVIKRLEMKRSMMEGVQSASTEGAGQSVSAPVQNISTSVDSKREIMRSISSLSITIPARPKAIGDSAAMAVMPVAPMPHAPLQSKTNFASQEVIPGLPDSFVPLTEGEHGVSSDVLLGAWHLVCLSRRLKGGQ